MLLQQVGGSWKIPQTTTPPSYNVIYIYTNEYRHKVLIIIFQLPGCFHESLTGGWATHLKKNMRKSNWILSPGVKIKALWNHHLPPPIIVVNLSSKNKNKKNQKLFTSFFSQKNTIRHAMTLPGWVIFQKFVPRGQPYQPKNHPKSKNLLHRRCVCFFQSGILQVNKFWQNFDRWKKKRCQTTGVLCLDWPRFEVVSTQKYWSNWIISANRDEDKKKLKPPPSWILP